MVPVEASQHRIDRLKEGIILAEMLLKVAGMGQKPAQVCHPFASRVKLRPQWVLVPIVPFTGRRKLFPASPKQFIGKGKLKLCQIQSVGKLKNQLAAEDAADLDHDYLSMSALPDTGRTDQSMTERDVLSQSDAH